MREFAEETVRTGIKAGPPHLPVPQLPHQPLGAGRIRAPGVAAQSAGTVGLPAIKRPG